MKIQVISDTHFDHWGDKGFGLAASIPVASEVLVHAGDFGSLRHKTQAVERFKQLAYGRERVFFVLGNHDYWGMSPSEAQAVALSIEEQVPQLRVLHMGRIEEYKGVRFLGDTMWFPWDKLADVYALDFIDFEYVPGLSPWVYDRNKEFRSFLEENLRRGDVLVTHHVPSQLAMDPAYASSPFNRFFLSDISNILMDASPAAAVFGHTHTAFSGKLGGTQLVCNPRGYPKEPHATAAFQNSMLVEV